LGTIIAATATTVSPRGRGGGCRPWRRQRMGKRIIEVPLDGEQVVLVEVDDEDFYQGGDALAPVTNVDEMLARAGGSVRSTMDNVIMPTMHTIFDRINEGRRAPNSVEVEFGLKLVGTLGAVFASTQARCTFR
jgi:hypothetical protein